MQIAIHPHAAARIQERGASEEEVQATIRSGEQFPAKHGRQGFRKNFQFDRQWQGRLYQNKQLEVYAVEELKGRWLVITVIVKYF